MRLVLLVICDDGIYRNGEVTVKTFKYFHPEAEIVLANTAVIDKYRKKYNEKWAGLIAPSIAKDVFAEKHPDILIKMGADCIVLSRMEEALSLNYDVASARNDPDQVVGDERLNRPDEIRDIPNHEWVNADLICCRNYDFLVKYEELTLDYLYGRKLALSKHGKVYRGDDQSSFNIVFRNGGFNAKILDGVGSDLVYGSSGNWNNGTSFEGFPNNWATWGNIEYINNQPIMTYKGFGPNINRKARVLHQGGGFRDGKPHLDLLSEQAKAEVNKILSR